MYFTATNSTSDDYFVWKTSSSLNIFQWLYSNNARITSGLLPISGDVIYLVVQTQGAQKRVRFRKIDFPTSITHHYSLLWEYPPCTEMKKLKCLLNQDQTIIYNTFDEDTQQYFMNLNASDLSLVNTIRKTTLNFWDNTFSIKEYNSKIYYLVQCTYSHFYVYDPVTDQFTSFYSLNDSNATIYDFTFRDDGYIYFAGTKTFSNSQFGYTFSMLQNSINSYQDIIQLESWSEICTSNVSSASTYTYDGSVPVSTMADNLSNTTGPSNYQITSNYETIVVTGNVTLNLDNIDLGSFYSSITSTVSANITYASSGSPSVIYTFVDLDTNSSISWITANSSSQTVTVSAPSGITAQTQYTVEMTTSVTDTKSYTITHNVTLTILPCNADCNVDCNVEYCISCTTNIDKWDLCSDGYFVSDDNVECINDTIPNQIQNAMLVSQSVAGASLALGFSSTI